MKMSYFIQFATLVILGVTVLVQAQTMRIYPKTSSWTDNVVSSLDSMSFVDSVNDSMRIYAKKGPILNFALSHIDSVKFVNSDNFTGTYGALADSRDGRVYKTVVIGSQTWMAENLNYGTFIKSSSLSWVLPSGAHKLCTYDIESNCNTNGGLYLWHTAMGFDSSCATANCSNQIRNGHHQGICPLGWHVPKAAEWDTLGSALGGLAIAGSKMKLNNTGDSSWDESTNNIGNPSGFSALPIGVYNGYSGVDGRGYTTGFWEATELYSIYACSRNLLNEYLSLYRNTSYTKTYGFSLRCVKD